jgi:hypothetical protein
MPLMVKKLNNGYWCSCCHDGWESSYWVDTPTPEEFIEEVYFELENKGMFEGIRCEEDGEIIFECRVLGSKSTEQWDLIKSNGDKLRIYNWNKKDDNDKQVKLPFEAIPTKEEALKWLIGV